MGYFTKGSWFKRGMMQIFCVGKVVPPQPPVDHTHPSAASDLRHPSARVGTRAEPEGAQLAGLMERDTQSCRQANSMAYGHPVPVPEV